MIKEMLSRKMLALFAGMAIIGFFIGYDYALITSRLGDRDAAGVSSQIERESKEQEESLLDEDYGLSKKGKSRDYTGEGTIQKARN